MDDKLCNRFQSAVDDYLVRHRSILDVLTKYQEATSRVNRAFAKAVTECGCITINSARQQVPPEATYSELKQYMSCHLSNEPCEHCQEILTKEMGRCLFYMAALSNTSGLNLNDIIEQELKTIRTLGVFHLS